MSAAIPTPDRAEIARAISVLHAPDSIIELRALHQKGRKRTDAGYFDAEHRQELVETAAKLNIQGAAVYIVMNEIDAQLLARHANRLQEFAPTTATDANVVRRHWLLVDIDPVRPKDTSATQEQLAAAMDRARKVYGALGERGWPKPVVAESGNGAHLLYRVNLQNDDQARDLVKGCLEALAAKFDDLAVKIDRSVFNAARIIKLHGTIANKGDNVPSAPWRLSKLRDVPEKIEPVSVDLLQALAAEAAPKKPNGQDRPAGNGMAWTEGGVSDFLRRGGIEWLGEPAPHDGSTRWRLRRCPFNPDHGATESAVFLASDGRLGFHCAHNSCADKHWSDLRELVDGPRESRHSDNPTSGSASQKSQVSQSQAEPTPLIRPIPAAAAFPIDALGPVLASAARAIAEIVQVPEALAANTVLASAALAAQSHANVQTLGGARPLALYVLTIAGSGDRKTAADDVALTPVREHVRRATLTYQTAMAEHERVKEARKLDRTKRRKEAQSGNEYAAALREITDEPAPRKPWVICSDPTAEGLMRSLAEGQYGQGIFTDEGGQFLGGHALSEEAELRTIAMLSRVWQGAPLDRVRATDSEHVILYGRRVSMHLLVQPDVATRMLGSQLYRSQGFLARWLMAAPASLAGTRRHDPSRPAPVDDPRIRRYWHAVAQLLESPTTEDHEVGGLALPCLALSPEARSLLVAAYDEIETAQGRDGELEPVREWASKAAEHACRIAGVLTLTADPAATQVGTDAMEGALRLTEHYLSEYIRLVGSAGVSQEIQHAQLLLEWVRRKSLRSITSRQVMRLGPGSIRSADIARVALRALVEHGWLASDDGRSYAVHPAALQGDAP